MMIERPPESKAVDYLEQSVVRICDSANSLKCIHKNRAKGLSRIYGGHLGLVVVANVLTAFLLTDRFGSSFSTSQHIAAIAAVVAAICTGLLLSFDYRGKAGRHSELASCYASLRLTCQAELNRYRAGRLDEDQFDGFLKCSLNMAKELELRSYGLDSRCVASPDRSHIPEEKNMPSAVGPATEVSG